MYGNGGCGGGDYWNFGCFGFGGGCCCGDGGGHSVYGIGVDGDIYGGCDSGDDGGGCEKERERVREREAYYTTQKFTCTK